MSRPSSSTSSSETLRGLLATAAWFVAFIGLFEVALLTVKQLSGSAKYFDYGLSVETKLRALAANAAMSPRHVFNAGWLDDTQQLPAGKSYEIALYGMSFAKSVSETLREQRPSLNLREFYGPGAPLSHAYAAYQRDAPRRRAEAVLIPLLSDGIPYLRTMTHDTLSLDNVQPVTWPRYGVRAGKLELLEESPIRSADALRAALLREPALWQQHLAALGRHDDYFLPGLYDAHWSENLATLRLFRRARYHSQAHARRAELIDHAGFIPGTQTAELARALLRSYIADVRANGELPIVVLFDSPGEPGWINALVRDVLAETRVPTVRSQDHCDASHLENFTDDGHYQPHCNHKLTAEFLRLFDEQRSRRLAASEPPPGRSR